MRRESFAPGLCRLLLCLWAALPSGHVRAQGVQLTEPNCNVVIVGGGMAGLSAAFFLKEKGVNNLMVLEKQAVPGGRLSAAYYIGKPEKALNRIVMALQLKPLEIPAPMDAAYCDGHFWWGDDGRALMRITRSSLSAYNTFVAKVQQVYRKYDDIPQFDPTSDLARLDDIPATKWFDELDFACIYDREYNVAALGLFGANLGEISALSLIPELGFDFEGDKPVKDIDASDNTPNQKEHTRSSSFVNGLARVGEVLAADLGDQLRVNCTMTQVLRTGQRFVVE